MRCGRKVWRLIRKTRYKWDVCHPKVQQRIIVDTD